MKKAFKFKYVSISLKALLYLFLLFTVFTLITSKTPIIAGIRSFVVQTGSMQPTMPVGSIVYVQKKPTYNISDVIAFNNKADQTVTHRIVEVVNKPEGVFYKVKGDANNTADSDLVKAKSVIGRAVFTVPLLGRLVQFLRTLPGFLGLIILPAVIFIGFEVWNIKKEMEKEIEKKVLKKMNIT